MLEYNIIQTVHYDSVFQVGSTSEVFLLKKELHIFLFSFMSHLLAPPPCRARLFSWLALWYGMVSHWLSGHCQEYSPRNSFSNLKQHYSAVLGLGALLSSPTWRGAIQMSAMNEILWWPLQLQTGWNTITGYATITFSMTDHFGKVSTNAQSSASFRSTVVIWAAFGTDLRSAQYTRKHWLS